MIHAQFADWGYLAIVLGVFLEGEVTLMAAGALAQHDSLLLPGVVASGWLGSFLWSQLWFRAGRRAGYALLDRHPEWRARVARVQQRVSQFAAGYMLLCRFIAGLGTASPAALGAMGFSPRRFALLDALSAAMWSAAVSCTGWGVGFGVRRLTLWMGGV